MSKLIDLLVQIGLQASKGDARRLIRNGGVYVNNEKIEDENCLIEENLLIDNRLFSWRQGKKIKCSYGFKVKNNVEIKCNFLYDGYIH